MSGDEFARSPCERFPAAGGFSVAPDGLERCSPPPPAPLPDRFVPSPRRIRRIEPVDRHRTQRRARYVPPAAHVPVERYVPRPSITPPPPIRPQFYCAPPCRPSQIRKCCPDNSPPAPTRYVEFARTSCNPPPPQLGMPLESNEPPCCAQARRRPPIQEWRPSPRLSTASVSCHPPSQSQLMCAPPASPRLAVQQGPSTPQIVQPPPPQPSPLPREPSPECQVEEEEEVVLRRPHTVVVRDYLKRETQNFFGIQPDNEKEQLRLWKDRRRRLAFRTLGDLKPELPPQHHTDEDDISMYGASGVAPREARGPSTAAGCSNNEHEHPEAYLSDMYKESVARLTFNGLSYLVTAMSRKVRQSTSQLLSRSVNRQVSESNRTDPDGISDEVFYASPPSDQRAPSAGSGQQDERRNVCQPLIVPTAQPDTGIEVRRDAIDPGQDGDIGQGAGGRVHFSFLDRTNDNADRRQFGMGVVGRFFRRSFRKSVTEQEEVVRQLDCMADYRPYFTWWASTVQTCVLVLSILCYGFGPIGFGRHTQTSQVLVKSLSLQQVEYEEPASFWLGPRAADLIHLGAKYAPCMRKDVKIGRAIAASARKERDTACCIRNDDSGCVQSSKADCSNTISTWKKWTNNDAGPGGRISGPVCGLDPKYCEAPASVAPYEWPDDITKWPICRKIRGHTFGAVASGKPGKAAEHMACEVIAHPCCIGVHGQCVITTKEHCDFVRGSFHEEASLCSQISCLDNVCGMLPFMVRQQPDQLYRAWTSLFVHAGVLHLAITLSFQWLLMRDLEKMAGPVRVAAIYLGSGIAGNLASAVFEPYRAEVGPAGSHFGMLACLIVEVVNAWPLLKHPNRSLTKLLLVVFVLFMFGLLPWVDNFANFFGFIFGFLLSYALLPFVSVGRYNRRRKIFLVSVCLLSSMLLLSTLVAFFYGFPNYECDWCSYFSCVPLAKDMCGSHDIRVKSIDVV